MLRMSFAGGRRAGIFTALGIGTGNTVHVAYTVLGLATLITHSPGLFQGIQVAGACVLLYLGIGCFRSQARREESALPVGISPKKAFVAGLFTNLFNGQAALWYVSIMSQFMGEARAAWVRYAYGAEILTVTVLWFLALAWIAGHPDLRGRLERWQRRLVPLLGAVLILLAGRILIRTFAGSL
jgi:threonine/homoserine/homoserine lactone efflux protein